MTKDDKRLIQITQTEADYIIKNVRNNRLHKTSARKKHGGKTYFVLRDDFSALRVLAKLRNTTIHDIKNFDAKVNV